jgi:23S rRNA pseudouridine1911/1915/1917 synthase
MKIKILYEDKDILVIDKPSGISVHPDGRSKEKTIVDWVMKNYPKMKNVGESMFFEDKEIFRPGIVHRLDKDTSGVLLLAKNKNSYEFLKKQFQDREVKKTYNAIVLGWVKNDRGIVNKTIGRSPNDFRKKLAGRGARGELREAITEYRVLKRFELIPSKTTTGLSVEKLKLHKKNTEEEKNSKIPLKFTFLEIRPKTGRTHQIRVHMKFLNHPVASDTLYNPGKPYPKGLTRLSLHARSIKFKNLKGEEIKVESHLPKEMKEVVK